MFLILLSSVINSAHDFFGDISSSSSVFLVFVVPLLPLFSFFFLPRMQEEIQEKNSSILLALT